MTIADTRTELARKRPAQVVRTDNTTVPHALDHLIAALKEP